MEDSFQDSQKEDRLVSPIGEDDCCGDDETDTRTTNNRRRHDVFASELVGKEARR